MTGSPICVGGFLLAVASVMISCGGSTHAQGAHPPDSGESVGTDELPAHAYPRGGTVDPASLQGKDLIAYRTLTPSDFKADHPPQEMRHYAERLGALTCANVFTYPQPRYLIEETEEGFEGAYINLGFVARLDRECSWWNPKRTQVPEQYVLQHEQIHFALAESAARRLNQEAASIRALRIKGRSQEQVDKELRGAVEDLLEAAVEELVGRNLQFDQETSNTYAPKAQSLWFEKVMKELEQ